MGANVARRGETAIAFAVLEAVVEPVERGLFRRCAKGLWRLGVVLA